MAAIRGAADVVVDEVLVRPLMFPGPSSQSDNDPRLRVWGDRHARQGSGIWRDGVGELRREDGVDAARQGECRHVPAAVDPVRETNKVNAVEYDSSVAVVPHDQVAGRNHSPDG